MSFLFVKIKFSIFSDFCIYFARKGYFFIFYLIKCFQIIKCHIGVKNYFWNQNVFFSFLINHKMNSEGHKNCIINFFPNRLSVHEVGSGLMKEACSTAMYSFWRDKTRRKGEREARTKSTDILGDFFIKVTVDFNECTRHCVEKITWINSPNPNALKKKFSDNF